ncbi:MULTISPECIES: RNase adapter RapZ [Eubacterium]|uniref:UPF0042 nucleotide-binding protein n=1 Tax=Eubacterium uniforme TaxID=39495 RepID=A0A1T4VHS6_9FIRM|nr:MULTISPECIES: RNase adapter RapZ [Eubacterium]MCR5629190.1 RNase adapter RapZ [Eubacterium sp.]SKA64487.1 UPF0042 nucleotide-binding protein [Eubacterium uniforme]HAV91487.1 RNase adapter RapZ [Eubacterium sp.]
MRFVIVTGMSGAGKSSALKILEDFGFFCVDNLPIKLIDTFADLTFNPTSDLEKVAMGIDIRSGEMLAKLTDSLDILNEKKQDYEILFLEANDNVLLKRYKESRRKHPLSKYGNVEDGIRKEREKLAFLKKRADYIIDTSNILVRDLRGELDKIFIDNGLFKNLYVRIISFGYKHGIPQDADLVFDVRFMPNPYYIDELKNKTGEDEAVQEYVMNSEAAQEFLCKLKDMVNFLIPNYISEGRNQLVIAIGCTGGHHRSVTIANKLYEELKKNEEYGIKKEHRDIAR